jgi:hypothetical protein
MAEAASLIGVAETCAQALPGAANAIAVSATIAPRTKLLMPPNPLAVFMFRLLLGG